jgi:hypothetical protein
LSMSGNDGAVGDVLVSQGNGSLPQWVAGNSLCSTCYVNNGNSFGSLATLGTNDAQNLAFETNGVTRMTLSQTGRLVFSNTNGGNTSLYIGRNAGNEATGGGSNTAIGSFTLTNNTNGFSNTAVGMSALTSNTIGTDNSAFGKDSQALNQSGSFNSSFGVGSLGFNTSGSENTAVGTYALRLTAGNLNTGLGRFAGDNLQNGNNNIAIGAYTNFVNINGSNQLNLGNAIFGTGLTGTIGSPAGLIGIGVNTPTSTLDINGATTYRGVGTPGLSAAGTGRMYFDNTSNKYKCSENGTAYFDCYGGSTTRISALTSAIASNVAVNANNSQVWYWQLTGATNNAMTFGEIAASTGGGSILRTETLAGSTARPFTVVARGNTVLDVAANGGTTIGNSTANTPFTVVSGTSPILIGNDAFAKSITIGNSTGLTALNLVSGAGSIELNGASRFTTNNIANLPTGGNIGTAAATVDILSSFNVNQTTVGQTITLPNPTSTLNLGRMALINNIGTTSFNLLGAPLNPGQSRQAIWNGSAWSVVGNGVNPTPISALVAATATNTINNANFAQNWQWNTLGANNALTLSSSDTAQTGSLLNVTSGSTSAFTNGGARFAFSGNYTGSGLNVESSATTAGTTLRVNGSNQTGIGANFGFNSLTSGNGMYVGSSSAALNTNNGILHVQNSGASTNGLVFKVDANSSNLSTLAVGANGNVGININPTAQAKLDVVQQTGNATARFTNYGNPNDTIFRRAQGTFAAPTAVNTGTILGRFQGQGYSGGFLNAASINFETDTIGTVSGTSMPGAITFNTSVDGTTSLTERVKINNAGVLSIRNIVSCTGSNALQTNASGDVACGAVTSDMRIKNILGEYDQDAIKAITGLEIKNFSYKTVAQGGNEFTDDGGKLHTGFIAQNVQKYIPNAVKTNNFSGQTEEVLSLDPVAIQAVMVKAIQQQQKQIDGLGGVEVDGLKLEIENLKTSWAKEIPEIKTQLKALETKVQANSLDIEKLKAQNAEQSKQITELLERINKLETR